MIELKIEYDKLREKLIVKLGHLETKEADFTYMRALGHGATLM